MGQTAEDAPVYTQLPMVLLPPTLELPCKSGTGEGQRAVFPREELAMNLIQHHQSPLVLTPFGVDSSQQVQLLGSKWRG